ncbi:TetR/AcrR family transcriptional regulator [Microbacterium halotolerans]|uniref:TetR/AcrR family transcriptional regulator n=1 Tax=Microbacterium halotolerans TaxID=246613 RepID=UPI000E6ADB53|nr:TetR family transcriptional regulator [Microbacterium halotolerans]
MTNLGDRAKSPRGQRTRESLIDAGIELLVEGGWSAVTTRAVAARSASNAGLVHYHFGGLSGLRMALAERAAERAVGPLVGMLLNSADFDEAISAVHVGITELASDDQRVRLAAELVAGAGHDSQLGAAFQKNLSGARDAITGWVGAQRPQWSQERRKGVAALAAALLDGFLLHRALDESAPLAEAVTALRAWVSADDRGTLSSPAA